MTANEIRKKFLAFFESKGHRIVESDSVVPKDDPTVLFTTAGMQQFKRQFLGDTGDYTRAATSQKCLRTDDLDVVGTTDVHHTFFEMLGNFSFGDYFKKEAIAWAWEFFTEVLKIPKERLWVSVYQDDDEAYNIWKNDIKLPAHRIFKLGDKSNFWPANAKQNGPNGPCGPCSEIFYDREDGDDKNADIDSERFAEVWNLVFTQYNRKDGGVLEPLPSKNIDTGMGLERLVAVLQGKKNNFDTDLFAPVFSAIEREIVGKGAKLELREKRVIADHIRAVVFAIADGVIPSNKERGSVVKRLINDSTNLALSGGLDEPSIYKLVPSVVEAMIEPYPYLKNKAASISDLIRRTEEAFIRVRRQRIPEFQEKIRKAATSEEKGGLMFEYRDTYGLPLSTILTIARSAGVEIAKSDREVFDRKMNEQKERSRAGSKIAGDVFADQSSVNLDVPKTKFLGYDHFEGRAKIIRIFKDTASVDSAREGDPVQVILDQTPFYAESGGQIGDTGTIKGPKGDILIEDTQKSGEIFIHNGQVVEGTVSAGETVEAVIDTERRQAVMKNHTATHILQAALRVILGDHVQQQGSLVDAERLRFDFTHPKAITPKEIAAIEEFVNTRVQMCDAVSKDVMSLEKARKSGALAFFAEKYGETVRVVSVGDYSKEFCGGTHLQYTGEIGLFKITGESAIAQGIRRIEARTGKAALEWIDRQREQLRKIAEIVKSPESELLEKISAQTKRLKQLEKDLSRFRFDAVKHEIDGMIKKAKKFDGVSVIAHIFSDVDIAILRQIADLINSKLKNGVAVIGSTSGENAYLLIAASDGAVKKGIKANDLIKEIAPVMDGSGGGRPALAQAGSKKAAGLPKAVKEAEKRIKELLPR